MEISNVLMGTSAIETNKLLTTVLGSCVSICFIDKTQKIAAMTHYMAPKATQRLELYGRSSGEVQLFEVWKSLMLKNIKISNLEVYLFGGGEMFESSNRYSIGQKNLDFANEWLKEKKLVIKGSCIGGPYSRNVKINPQTGQIFLKKTSREALEFDGSKLTQAPKLKLK